MPNYEKSLGQALWLIHEEREMRDRAYDVKFLVIAVLHFGSSY
jgi:hypothetical protein